MCLLLHIGISYAIPEMTWNDKERTLNVKQVSDELILKTLNSPFAYYVGAREYCGCGFYYGYYFDYSEFEDEDDKFDKIAYDKDFDRLKTFLGKITDSTLQLMVTYGDFNSNMIFERQSITLSKFEMRCFRDVVNGSNPIIYTILISHSEIAS